MDESLKSRIRDWIKTCSEHYYYRPLPKKIRAQTYELYLQGLNGFGGPVPKPVMINGTVIASGYERVVVGDYGAYLELTEDQFTLKDQLVVAPKQSWRLNQEYVERAGLSIKYYWYELFGVKVYHQVATVKYADYKPGFYYLSVLDLD